MLVARLGVERKDVSEAVRVVGVVGEVGEVGEVGVVAAVVTGALEPASFLNASRIEEKGERLATARAFLRSRIAPPTFLLIARPRLMLEGPRQAT